MILQNIIFPKKEVCDKTELYYRVFLGECVNKETLNIKKNSSVSFDTYFNFLSLEKWKKYTVCDDFNLNINLKGKGCVVVARVFLEEDSQETIQIQEEHFDLNDFEDLKINLQIDEFKGMLFFWIKAYENCAVSSAYYYTNTKKARRVKIAAGICTFKREEYVKKTVNGMKRSILYPSGFDEESNPDFHVYISDNGNTLDIEELSEERVSVVYNKNYGGASGFTRCMIEALNDNDVENFTHFLFMDDDILVEPEVFYRTFSLLSMCNDEYSDVAIGGALLRKDLMEIQYASGEIWDVDRVSSPRANVDISEIGSIINNEREIEGLYNGWWYSCVPFSNNKKKDLPLPIFIHMDDIEYGLRHNNKVLYLNGIAVWHDSFDNRKASSMEYYDMRNLLITNALTNHDYNWKDARKRVCRHLVAQLLKYRYEDIDITVRGVEDFCKGIDFLKSANATEIHQDLLKSGYVLSDYSDELDSICPKWRTMKNTKQSLKMMDMLRFSQKIMFNGWCLPGKKSVQVLPIGVHTCKLFRVKRVIYFDPDTGRGFETERKYGRLVYLIRKMFYVSGLLKNHYFDTAEEFRSRVGEITNIEFWNSYLEL